MCAVSGKYSASTDLYGDLTARLGYATDRTLFYVKGGVAIVDADIKAHYDGANCLTYGECTPIGNTQEGVFYLRFRPQRHTGRLDRRSGC